jgi:hypothetical protein
MSPATCHICSAALSQAYPLSVHVADVHSEDSRHVTVIAVELGLPVVECDIDRIHAVYAARGSRVAEVGTD